MLQKTVSVQAYRSSSDLLSVLRASTFASGLLSFLAFGALLFSSTSAYLLLGEVTVQAKRIQFGVGPFVAGSSSLTSDVVWWSELNAGNVCDKATAIYSAWSFPHQLCSENGKFNIPAAVVALQVVSSLATAFSFIACTVSFSSSRIIAARITAFCSFVAMVFACTHFAIWTTYPLAVKLQSEEGDVIPVWDSSANRFVPSKPVRMYFGVSFALFVASFALLFCSATLSYSIARLPARFFDDDDEGSYGLGKL